MNKGRAWPLYLTVALLFAGSVACIVWADRFSSNRASIVGGVLSTMATALLGAIAFWQNKRYKELSDEMTDRMCMPELYQAETIGEMLENLSKSSYNAFVFRMDTDEKSIAIDCSTFGVLNSPIINVCVKIATNHNDFVMLERKEETYSLYGQDVGFHLFLKLPQSLVMGTRKYNIIFEYENIYGTKYEKCASFVLQTEESTQASQWKFDRARRTI